MELSSRRSVLVAAGAVLGGCTTPFGEGSPVGGTVTPSADSAGYPHLRPSGNRVAAGQGALPDVDPATIDLPAAPTWLSAVPTAEGSLWAIADQSETLRYVAVGTDGGTTRQGRREWVPTRPPVLRPDGRAVDPDPGDSALSPPLLVPDGRVAVVTDERALSLRRDRRFTRIPANLSPDTRLCRIDERRVAAVGGPTTAYDHGALGDGTEASEVVVVDVTGATVERRIAVPEGRVVEGVAPIVTDLGGDRAVVVTESGPDKGAALAAYGPDGSTLARGDPIGTGLRWRHQLAVAPFGPDGRREIAVVKTPHIGGTVEFYARDGDSLDVVATITGASTHAFGSRNLDGAVAADADGDGRTELVVPTDDRRTLRGIERRGGGGADEEWSVPVGGQLSTNVVGVRHGDGGLAVGVGHSDGSVRVWPSG